MILISHRGNIDKIPISLGIFPVNTYIFNLVNSEVSQFLLEFLV